MWKEDFTYCDQVTKQEENQPATKIRLVDLPMQISCIENAWIVPRCQGYEDFQGEVIDAAGRVVPNVSSGAIYKDDKARVCPPIASCQQDDAVIYLGSINICWGHYITDGISKMWCLDSPEFQALVHRGVKVAFTSEWVNVDKMPGAWRHVVDCLGGGDIEIVPITQVTHYQRIYIPTNSLYNTSHGRFYTKEFVQTVHTLMQNALQNMGGKTYDRLYLSRTHLPSNHGEFGERYLEKLFRRVGYTIIYPEEMSFEQQVYYLSHAKSVAGTMGSISHNFMFCQPGTEVTILRKAWYTNDFQYVINQAFDLNVTYVDCHLSVFTTDNPNLGPFYMYANSNVQQFFKDRYGKIIKNNFSTREYLRYVRICLKRPDMKQRTGSPEYYYTKMREELKNDNWKRQLLKVVETLMPKKIMNILLPQIVRIGR